MDRLWVKWLLQYLKSLLVEGKIDPATNRWLWFPKSLLVKGKIDQNQPTCGSHYPVFFFLTHGHLGSFHVRLPVSVSVLGNGQDGPVEAFYASFMPDLQRSQTLEVADFCVLKSQRLTRFVFCVLCFVICVAM